MHRGLRQPVDDRRPGLAVVLADENVRVIVVVEVAVHRQVDAPRRMLRRHDAADVEHRRQAAQVARQIAPVLAAIAGHLQRAIVGAGVEHIAVERRFGDHGQALKFDCPSCARERVGRHRRAHHRAAFSRSMLAVRSALMALPAHAAIVGAEQHVGAGVNDLRIEAGDDHRRGPIPAIAAAGRASAARSACTGPMIWRCILSRSSRRGGAVLRADQQGVIVALEHGLHAVAAADVERVFERDAVAEFGGRGRTPVAVVLQARRRPGTGPDC